MWFIVFCVLAPTLIIFVPVIISVSRTLSAQKKEDEQFQRDLKEYLDNGGS